MKALVGNSKSSHRPSSIDVANGSLDGAVNSHSVWLSADGSIVASSSVPVEFVGLDGQDLPLDDESVDAALATWTLCSIPDPVAAVREIGRVLRPGADFHFVEHGCSPDPRVSKWQKRLNPLQRRLACGCNLDRDIPSIIEAGGLKIGQLDTYYVKGDPKIFGWTFEGTARLM